jgi:hypothetical protein
MSWLYRTVLKNDKGKESGMQMGMLYASHIKPNIATNPIIQLKPKQRQKVWHKRV